MQLPDAAGAGGGDVAASLMAPAAVATRLFPSLALTGSEVIDLAHGKRIKSPLPDSGPIAALAPDGRLVALVSVAGGIAKSLVVFPADEVLA